MHTFFTRINISRPRVSASLHPEVYHTFGVLLGSEVLKLP
jgi:hypothetical protein